MSPSSPSVAHGHPTDRDDHSVLAALRSPIRLRTELFAGLAVALALIPEAISFSILAGVDPRVGLYASFTMAVTVIGVTAIGVTGRLAFGVTTSPAALPGVIVLTIIGTSMFLCLSFAIASFARSNSAAQGMSNGVGIVLALISGVFFAPSILPDAVGDVARYLPLEPLANSYQSLYVTDASGLGLDLGNIAVLVGWTIVAIAIVAVRGFRWKPFQQR